MKKLIISAAILAAFFVSGCAQIDQADAVIDRSKDRAITALEFSVQRANGIYDRLLIEYQEDGHRLLRLGKVLGRYK